MYTLFQKKKNKTKEVYLLLHGICAVILMSVTFHNMLFYMMSILLMIGTLMTFYEDEILIKLQSALFLFFIGIFSRILGILLTRSVSKIIWYKNILEMGQESIELVFYEIIFFVLISVVICKIKKFRFPIESGILMIFMLILGITERILRFYHIDQMVQTSPVLQLCMNLMVLLICFILFFLLIRYDMLSETNSKASQLLEHYSDREIYYKDIEAQNEQLLKIKHDFKNQLIALRGMVHHENQVCLEEIEFLLKECDRENAVYTRHHGFYSILKQKIREAQSLGIEVIHEIHIPKTIVLMGIEAGTLIGNLMDNAIESCMKMDESNKKIRILIETDKGCLFIHVKNSTKSKNMRSVTQMKRAKGRGHGIRNINAIVHKYHGIIEMDIIEGFFETKIMLCDVL